MNSRFYLSLLLISSLVLIAFLGVAFNREFTPEWKQYQSEYKDFLVKNAKDEFPDISSARQFQLYIPGLILTSNVTELLLPDKFFVSIASNDPLKSPYNVIFDRLNP